MEKRCLGCGALLQNTDSSKIGYVQDIKMDYCKRCFQMIHYDIHNDNDFVTDNNLVLEKLRTLTGQYVWIIDIFDLDRHNWMDLSPKLAKLMDTIIKENETDISGFFYFQK